MLVCKKTLGWRREFIEERILKLNPKVGLMKIMNTKNIENIRKTGRMLWKVKMLWMKEIEDWGNGMNV